MSLHIVRTPDERLVGAAVEDALARSVTAGAAVLLVPTARQAMDARRALAEVGGSLTVGVACSTPASWASDLWRRHGDGRVPVDAAQRVVLVGRSLAQADADGVLDHGAGTVRLLMGLVRGSLADLPAAGDLATAGMPDAELRAVEVARAYGELAREAGLVETCEVLGRLPQVLAERGVRVPGVVLAGFGELASYERSLVLGLARCCEVTFVAHIGMGPAFGVARAEADRLAEVARHAGLDVDDSEDGREATPCRAEALDALRGALFRAGEPGVSATDPEGSVRLLEPAGPLAEAELVAQEVVRLAESGARRVVVCSPDVSGAMSELAPKLVSRGIGVRARLSEPLCLVPEAAAFLGFSRAVARLAELAESWPGTREVAGEQVPQLGDMSWWPPREVMDFLLSDASGVSARDAWARDADWRGNRLLSPAGVLETLQKGKLTSPVCALATNELLKGHIGTAAERLRAALDASEAPSSAMRALARARACAALASVRAIATSLRGVGATADAGVAERTGRAQLPLSELVGLVEAAASQARVTSRPRLAVPGSTCEVELLSPRDASALPAGSADALLWLGLDTQRGAIAPADGALELLLDHLGLACRANAMGRAREEFHAVCGVPRDTLVLERTLFDATSSETFPAVMLVEAYAALGLDEQGRGDARERLLVRTRGEGELVENLSATGARGEAASVELPVPSGRVSDSRRELVLVPNVGEASRRLARRSLSASQIESYLECPLKWFTLRRLGLDDADSGFTNLEMGSFAHRVMEQTHRRLRDEAAARVAEARGWDPASGLDTTGDFDPEAELATRLAGSRIGTGEGDATLEHACQVLDEEFDLHLAHLFLASAKQSGRKKRLQALIPHRASEEVQLAELRQDLEDALAFEAGRFLGFEPRLFEHRFGGASGAQVEYAGVTIVGSIDRVDVDAAGNLLVIDYKHKGSLFSEYALRADKAPEEFALPRRVQSLIYATAIRRELSEGGLRQPPRVLGALYFGTRGQKAISGAMDDEVCERVFGGDASERRLDRVRVPYGEVRSMDELLERTEEAIGEAVAHMLAGDVEARPVDDKACDFCPVTTCERRRG